MVLVIVLKPLEAAVILPIPIKDPTDCITSAAKVFPPPTLPNIDFTSLILLTSTAVTTLDTEVPSWFLPGKRSGSSTINSPLTP